MNTIDDYLIKRDILRILKENASKAWNDDWKPTHKSVRGDTFIEASLLIDDMPTADVQPVNQWISVKDKLPNEGERVLIYAPKTQYQYYIAKFYTLRGEIKFTMNIYGMSYCWYANDVTHWMPLPEPPKDGDAK